MSTVKVNAAQIGQSITTTNNFTLYQPATPDGTVRLGNGNAGSVTDIITLNSSGNVGIGTSSPATKLDVLGNSKVTGTLYCQAPSTTATFLLYGGSTSVDGAFSFKSQATRALTINDDYAGAERMRITSAGRIGVGLPAPKATFEVDVSEGTGQAGRANSNTVGSSISMGDDGATQPIVGVRWTGAAMAGIYGAAYTSQIVNDTANSNAFEIYTTGATPLVFGTNALNRAMINSSGQFIIAGTSNPMGGKFYVNGGASMRGFYAALTPAVGSGTPNNFGELNYTGQFTMTAGQTINLWVNNGYYQTQFFEIFVQSDYGPRITGWWRGQCSGYQGAVNALEMNNGTPVTFAFVNHSPATGNCTVQMTNPVGSTTSIQVWVRIFGTAGSTDAVSSSYIAPNL